MKIIIAGAGEVGFHLSKLLTQESHDIVIIDYSREALKKAAISLDVSTVKGDCTSKENLIKLQNCYLNNSPTMAELFDDYTEPYKNMITILDIDLFNQAHMAPENVQCVFDAIGSKYEKWFNIIYDKLEVGGYYIFDRQAIYRDKKIMDYLDQFLANKGTKIQDLQLKNIQMNVSEIKYFIKTTK